MDPEVAQKPAKPARTAAQIAAFERARAAREQNIIQKHKEAEAQKQAAEPVAEPPPPPPQTPPSPSPPPPPSRRPPANDYEFVEFNPDDFTSHVDYTKAELKALKEEIEALKSNHGQLNEDFAAHAVRRRNELYFV